MIKNEYDYVRSSMWPRVFIIVKVLVQASCKFKSYNLHPVYTLKQNLK